MHVQHTPASSRLTCRVSRLVKTSDIDVSRRPLRKHSSEVDSLYIYETFFITSRIKIAFYGFDFFAIVYYVYELNATAALIFFSCLYDYITVFYKLKFGFA